MGSALIVGPVLLVLDTSGRILGAITGLAAGTVLLATAGAGYRELARS